MSTKRIMATLPIWMKESLKLAADLQSVDHSIIVQDAITKMSSRCPEESEIKYKRGKTKAETVQITLSDAAYRLLVMWSEKTGLAKSKLVIYALQNVLDIEEEEKKEEEGNEQQTD